MSARVYSYSPYNVKYLRQGRELLLEEDLTDIEYYANIQIIFNIHNLEMLRKGKEEDYYIDIVDEYCVTPGNDCRKKITMIPGDKDSDAENVLLFYTTQYGIFPKTTGKIELYSDCIAVILLKEGETVELYDYGVAKEHKNVSGQLVK